MIDTIVSDSEMLVKLGVIVFRGGGYRKMDGAGQKRGLGKAVEMWYTGGELLGKSVFAGTDYGGHGQCVIFRSFFSFN